MISLLSILEDLKRGHLTTLMYVRYKSLMFNAPHVIIFSNKPCPRKDLSEDGWIILKIKKDKSFSILSNKDKTNKLLIKRNVRRLIYKANLKKMDKKN